MKPRSRFSQWATAAGTLALVVGACGGNSSPPAATPGAPVTFNVGIQDAGSVILPLIAEQQGYFKTENISVQYTTITSGTGVVVSGVVSGTFDAGAVALSTLMQTRQKGSEVLFVGGFNHSPRALGVVSKDTTTPVATGRSVDNFGKTLKALSGKTIGVPGLGGAPPKELDAMAKLAGMPSNSFRYIDVEPGAPTVAAFASASVAGVYSGVQFIAPAVQAGTARQVFTSNNGPEAYSASVIVGLMTNKKWLDAHPDFPARYQRAIDKATIYFSDRSHSKAIVDLLATRNFKLVIDPTDYFYNLVQSQGTISKGTLDNAIKFIFEVGVLPSSPSVAAADVVVAPALSK
jgi:ABC-type nitrate/sulfonate/bicarbonate transport system substrate-binding protein